MNIPFFHFELRSDPELDPDFFFSWAWSGSGSKEKHVGSSSLKQTPSLMILPVQDVRFADQFDPADPVRPAAAGGLARRPLIPHCSDAGASLTSGRPAAAILWWYLPRRICVQKGRFQNRLLLKKTYYFIFWYFNLKPPNNYYKG